MPGVEAHSGKFYSYRDTANKGGLFLPDKRYGIPVPTLQEVRIVLTQKQRARYQAEYAEHSVE